jgi:hypothetical protein
MARKIRKKISLDSIFDDTLENYLIQVRLLLLQIKDMKISDDEAEVFLYEYLKELIEAKNAKFFL